MITNLLIDNIEISGRLGNNLFQIAFLVGLERRLGYEYSIPFWRHLKDFQYVRHNPSLKTPSKVFKEHQFNYIEINNLGNLENDLIDFMGFFQSWRYFDFCREKILKTFEFNKEVYEKAYKFFKDINLDPKNVCALHIRRGDYIKKQNFHTNLLDNTNYYIEAIKIAKKDTDTFLIFSDDIEFCKKVLANTGLKIYFSENNTEVEDLCLMSLCRNFIIANSSFSWWGAYLSRELNKTVIAPKKWFEVTNIDTSDVIPKEWIQL